MGRRDQFDEGAERARQRQASIAAHRRCAVIVNKQRYLEHAGADLPERREIGSALMFVGILVLQSSDPTFPDVVPRIRSASRVIDYLVAPDDDSTVAMSW